MNMFCALGSLVCFSRRPVGESFLPLYMLPEEEEEKKKKQQEHTVCAHAMLRYETSFGGSGNGEEGNKRHKAWAGIPRLALF